MVLLKEHLQVKVHITREGKEVRYLVANDVPDCLYRLVKSNDTTKWIVDYFHDTTLASAVEIARYIIRHHHRWRTMDAVIEHKPIFLGLIDRVHRIYFETHGEYLPLKEISFKSEWFWRNGSRDLYRPFDKLTISVDNIGRNLLVLEGTLANKDVCFIIDRVRPTLWRIQFNVEVIGYESMMNLVHYWAKLAYE